ncbi:MAG: DNA adenine methylase [Lachnospiraceae bacterium]|nr:DNA adenine methylase [Lachnospiraceae bacterium]MBP3477570.1 DNA adenine methylase [Lachnospiraceae bacterium]
MKAVLKYPGAKNRIADWICSYIPKHDVYVEPFAGSLAVLFNKPRCHIETVNDLHGEVTNFFRVLRDKPDELKKLIDLTPYAREEYDSAYQESKDKVERARSFCVRCWMGFGCANLYHNGFKSGQQSHSPNPAKTWAELPDIMMQAAERLKGVQIENLPALEVLKRYDTPDVFVYADPPYLHGTRKNYLYKHEMSDRDHEELLDALTSHPGQVMISGYDNELYNRYLKGWRKVQKNTLAENGLKRTETLWMNYRDMQMSFNDFPEVMP